MKEIKILIQNKKALYITLLLSLIYVVPLLISEYEFLDDTGRNLYGYGWQHDGRFVATFLGKLFSLSDAVFSIYPFSLILSALILGFSGFLIVHVFNIEKENTIKWSSLLILTSPAFLGNLVFKFDCLPMSISLLVIVFPFLYYENKIKFILLSILGVFISFGLYQSSSTVFFIIGSFFLIQNIRNWHWNKFIINLLKLIGIYVFSFICYSLVISLFDVPLTNRAETILFQPDFSSDLYQNFKMFLKRIDSILKSGFYVFLIITFLLITFFGIFKTFLRSKRNIITFLSFFLVLSVDFLLISSVNLILKESYWDLRVFCGFGFFLLICLSFQTELKGTIFKLSRFITFLLVCFSFVLIAQFGRILTYQTQFQDAISFELNHYFKDESIKKIEFVGFMRIAPRNEFTYSKFPIFNNILYSPIGDLSAWTKNLLNSNGMLEGVEVIQSEGFQCDAELVEKTRFYYIRKINEETLIIDFDKKACD